eukprot:3803911-Amphidinium_carterae.1
MGPCPSPRMWPRPRLLQQSLSRAGACSVTSCLARGVICTKSIPWRKFICDTVAVSSSSEGA